MDLNVIVEDCGPRDPEQIIEQKIIRCKALGYKAIALSVVIDFTTETTKNSQLQIPKPPNNDEFFTDKQIKIYTRLTAKVSKTEQLYKLSKSKETSLYDLIALEPQNEKILQYISMGSADLDILTFDLTNRPEYHLFRVRFKVLEERGVCIEINYGPAQLGQSLRRNIICYGQNLIEKTTKNIILSSGISDPFRLRSPLDARSIGQLFMMKTDTIYDSVFNNGNKALQLAKHRANPASSAIELIKSSNDKQIK